MDTIFLKKKAKKCGAGQKSVLPAVKKSYDAVFPCAATLSDSWRTVFGRHSPSGVRLFAHDKLHRSSLHDVFMTEEIVRIRFPVERDTLYVDVFPGSVPGFQTESLAVFKGLQRHTRQTSVRHRRFQRVRRGHPSIPSP